MDKMLYDREKLDRQIEDTVSRVKAAASEDSLVMPVFTDLHANGLDDSAFVQLRQALEAVSSRLKIDAIIGLGDNLAMLGRNVHASNEMIKELLTGIFDRVSAVCDVPLYLVHGNHDGIGTDFFSAEFWYSIVGGKYDGGMAHREEGSAYFYADYENVCR